MSSGYIRTSYREESAFLRTAPRRAWMVVLFIGLLAFPWVASSLYVYIATLILIATVGAIGLNLLTGYTGQVSVGNAAFMAVGAFTAAYLATVKGWPFPLAAAAAGITAGLVGLIIAVPALRLKGFYLLLATLALHVIVVYFAQRLQQDQVGAAGFAMPEPTLGPLSITDPTGWFYLNLALASLVVVIAGNLIRTRIGRAWMAIRDRDIAAEIIGINLSLFKILAFVVSSTIIGFQGAMFGYFIGRVEVETFSLELGIQYVAMIVIGGVGSIVGSIYGAIFVISLPYLIRYVATHFPSFPGAELILNNIFQVQSMIYGASIIGFLLFEPKGLVEIWRRIQMYFQLWPYSRERLRSGGSGG